MEERMKIYIASSWKNAEIVFSLAHHLRKDGHKVDAFCDSSNGRYVFHWKEISTDQNKFNAKTFLQHKQSKKAFTEDKKWLDWCECLILVLPCGNSAHLEAGYVKGQGKRFYIWHPLGFPNGEFDVMYGFADGLVEKLDGLDSLRNTLEFT